MWPVTVDKHAYQSSFFMSVDDTMTVKGTDLIKKKKMNVLGDNEIQERGSDYPSPNCKT